LPGTATELLAKAPRQPTRGTEPFHMHFVIVTEQQEEVKQEDVMGRGLLLWLLGIPLPISILIWVLGGLHG
jgi:hypothetical protein